MFSEKIVCACAGAISCASTSAMAAHPGQVHLVLMWMMVGLGKSFPREQGTGKFGRSDLAGQGLFISFVPGPGEFILASRSGPDPLMNSRSHPARDLCPMRIFLIGPMCSGKTTVGRALAQRLGLPHVDVDRAVEARIGPLTPWVQREGEQAFRQEERATLLDLLEGPPAVVSCGGGTPMAFDNMDKLLAAGTVLYLDVSLPVLVDRCERKGTDRPLLFGLRGEALATRVADLLAERRPTYQRAHQSIPADEAPEQVVERILRTLPLQDK